MTRIVLRKQVGLSSLLLLTACCAVWYHAWRTSGQVNELAQRLTVSKMLSGELVVQDREHLSIIKQEEHTMDDHVWQVYVPTDRWKLLLATTDISKGGRLPAAPEPVVEAEAHLSPGRHTIELDTYKQGDEWVVEVKVDLEQVIRVKRPKSWNSARGSTGGGAFERQADFAADEQAVLFERVFFEAATAPGPMKPNPEGNGVKLWIAPQ
ncbi:MAG: hypothetical protein IT423_18400 [Pirellulaceae bacterium]|nr:hypothetical protein [Pirellulaceae bacterium]